MIDININELNEGDFLAKPVIEDGFRTLFFEGTKIRENDLERIKRLNIPTVSIFDREYVAKDPQENEILKMEVKEDCKEKVKDLLSGYVCNKDINLQEISDTAQEIIDDIFDEEEIVKKVFDIKKRSVDLYDHSISVSALAAFTAMKMNLTRENIYDIGVGSLLHDMGLKYITVDYKNKKENDLSIDDAFEFKKHTLYGFSSVENERWMSTISKKIILFHHERINGTGYPFRQSNIPIAAKIVAVCDGFDDRVCGIGYRKMSVKEALDDMELYRDTYYDGKVMDIFTSFVALYPVGTEVQLSSGDTAVVVTQNDMFADKPVVKVLKDSTGDEYKREIIINLADEDIEINNIIRDGE